MNSHEEIDIGQNIILIPRIPALSFGNKHMRTELFANGAYYHVYNRGIDKRTIFEDQNDYSRFLKSLRLFNSTTTNGSGLTKIKATHQSPERLIDILSFCLMNNHYHLLVKQLHDDGISKFMHRLGIGFTKYFNIRHERTGRLFESTFKAKPITTTGQLLNTSGYIHRNPLDLPEINQDLHKLKDYEYSSLPVYLNRKTCKITQRNDILAHFTSSDEYFEFMKLPISETKSRK